MFNEDLTEFFDSDTGFSVEAIYKSRKVNVMFDHPEEDLLGGDVSTVRYQITYITSDMPEIKHKDAITVNGINFTVKNPTSIEDGSISIAFLQKV